jgi:murein DD-endopeptidase MepM/ murein hydrolase activator NlpD
LLIRKFLLILTIGVLLSSPEIAHAQDNQPQGPVYIVQSGDNLTSIANQFGISSDELIAANGIADPNLLAVGDELVIPGLDGISGYLMTRTVSFGSTLESLAVENGVSQNFLIKLNHITSPVELYTGVSLIIPEKSVDPEAEIMYILPKEQSLLEFSILSNQNLYAIATKNQLKFPSESFTGQLLVLAATDQISIPGLQALPLGKITITPLPMLQGKTIKFQIAAPSDVQLSGSLTDHQLHFFPDDSGNFTALQGIHAMQEPGVYPLQITMTSPDGGKYSREQMVIIEDGYYGKDPIIMVKDEYIDPVTTQPEMDWLLSEIAPSTPEKYWNGLFVSPSPYSYLDCLNSRYGNRRSYNGGPFVNFHSGVDFCGGDGVNIFAAAAGKVVFSGPLTVRGNATLIDHGWGVYTGYWHQTVSYVKEGDVVEAGQVIGLVGATGRVTGAHLHWEVWSGGVQVSPLDWLEKVYP